MLILENLISRFENKNSRDLVENSSRIGITRLTLGSADVHIGHQKSATSEPAGTSENWRRQVADVDVIKIGFADPATGGGSAAAARRRRRVMMLKPAADSS